MKSNKLLTLLLLLAALVGSCSWLGHQQTSAHSSVSSSLVLISQGDDTLQAAESVSDGPSLSAAFVDQVLAAAHSPAQGIGQTLYTLSQQYHIDDAHALAFFHHESSYGKYGMAASTHSLGNIRCTAGYACDPTGGYRAYPSYAAAAHDWYQLLSTVYLARGLTTVSSIIPVYAPAADHNDETAYIHAVLADVTTYREGKVQL